MWTPYPVFGYPRGVFVWRLGCRLQPIESFHEKTPRFFKRGVFVTVFRGVFVWLTVATPKTSYRRGDRATEQRDSYGRDDEKQQPDTDNPANAD